jgi:hypothetical protein
MLGPEMSTHSGWDGSSRASSARTVASTLPGVPS